MDFSLTSVTSAVKILSGNSLLNSSQAVSPETFDVAESPTDTLRGGDAEENAEILKAVLAGEEGPRRDVVLVNAAAALIVGDISPDWTTGMLMARESIDGGAARSKLDELVRVSNAGGSK